MATALNVEYHGIGLGLISHEIDRLFGFVSDWQVDADSEDECYEYDGKIIIRVKALDRLRDAVEVGPGDLSHVVRYAMAHLKAHHYQELTPTYSKSYAEDPRPYELEADMIAGWICANAQLPNSFRLLVASHFNDFGRLKMMDGGNGNDGQAYEYPWPEERVQAFIRGGRMWVTGRYTIHSPLGLKLGLDDESFPEFLSVLPIYVKNQWQRPVPVREAEKPQDYSLPQQSVQLEDRVPISGGRLGS